MVPRRRREWRGIIFTWNLSGSIEPERPWSPATRTTTIAFQVDFADEAWSTSNGLWNGKVGDGALLRDGSAATIDYVVVDATRFENKDYVRNYGITEPSAVYDPLEWTATPSTTPRREVRDPQHGAPAPGARVRSDLDGSRRTRWRERALACRRW